MSDAENQVQKHFVNFSKTLPHHVDLWRSVLQESAKPLQNLENLSEQWRHIHNCKLNWMDNFEEAKNGLKYEISNRIEEELVNLKVLIDKLSKSNNDLKNKLSALEKSTLSLNWEESSELIRGNGSRPSLSRLLQNGLAFLTFFSKNGRAINECFKRFNLNDEKCVKELRDAFNIDLNNKIVIDLIALTQYVDNENAII